MNDELTPREHSEMRDSILAGAQRIHSTGQRRMQLIAASVAFVLVAGISGGAVATAALVGSGIDDGPVATPTETAEPSQSATPTPTLSPEPTPEPTVPVTQPEAVAAFGGDCDAVLTLEEAAAASGKPMRFAATAWSPGEDAKAGGISCIWTTSEEYMGAHVRVEAYPTAAAQAAGAASPESCETQTATVICSFSGTSADLWLSVSVGRSAFDSSTVDADAVRAAAEEVRSLAVTRADGFATPRAVERTADWWTIDGCEAIVADLESAGAVPPDSIVHDFVDTLADDSPGIVTMRSGLERWCSVEGGPAFTLWPGGADALPAVFALEGSKVIDVPGAAQAVLAPSLDPYEGHYAILLASDGVNLLGVTVEGFDGVTQRYIDAAAALMHVMASR